MEEPVIVYEEGLPLPWVHYPGGCAFVGFSEKKDSPVFFCECMEKAFTNQIELKKKAGLKGEFYRTDTEGFKWYYPMKNYLTGFPRSFTKQFENEFYEADSILQYVNFKKGLCHKCNQKMPTVELIFAGYNTFMQHYGWYIERKKLELGYLRNDVFLDSFPEELRELAAEMNYYHRIWEEESYKPLGDPSWNCERQREAELKENKVARRFHNIIENMVREEFNYKRIGEHWTNETTLYHLVRQILPGEEVIFHCRQDFLKGLELDIFVPDRLLGIEYQGIQHFEPMKMWGGEEALKRTQEHDLKKKRLCRRNGVILVYFDYRDELSEELVRERLREYIE